MRGKRDIEYNDVIENKYGVFTYNSNDKCIFASYHTEEEQAIDLAMTLVDGGYSVVLEDGEYVEVWEKIDGVYGNTGSPIYKSDAISESAPSTEEEVKNITEETVVDTYLKVL